MLAGTVHCAKDTQVSATERQARDVTTQPGVKQAGGSLPESFTVMQLKRSVDT